MRQPEWAGRDPWPHGIAIREVNRDLEPEVLNWEGRDGLVFQAGMGNHAHGFDDFAAKLNAWHHAYGITRRGRARLRRLSSTTSRTGSETMCSRCAPR